MPRGQISGTLRLGAAALALIAVVAGCRQANPDPPRTPDPPAPASVIGCPSTPAAPPPVIHLSCPKPPVCPSPPPPPPTCSDDLTQWQQRFDYVASLVGWRNFAAARLLLASGLVSCSPDVRREAKRRLDGIEETPPADCPGLSEWQSRLDAAHSLIDAKRMADARVLLLPAIAACDATVRDAALVDYQRAVDAPPSQATPCSPVVIHTGDDWATALKYAVQLVATGHGREFGELLTPALKKCNANVCGLLLTIMNGLSPVKTHWYDPLLPALNAIGAVLKYIVTALDVPAKALIVFGLAYWLTRLLIRSWIRRNREKLAIVPLTVVGEGYDGSEFAGIVKQMSDGMLDLQNVQRKVDSRLRFGANGEFENLANISTSDLRPLGDLPGADDTPVRTADHAVITFPIIAIVTPPNLAGISGLISNDSGGKLIAAAVMKFVKPYYRVTGSVFIDNSNTDILIKVVRGDDTILRWQKNSSKDRLTSDLKDCALAILQLTAPRDRPADEKMNLDSATFTLVRQALSALQVQLDARDATSQVGALQALNAAPAPSSQHPLVLFNRAMLEDLLWKYEDARRHFGMLAAMTRPWQPDQLKSFQTNIAVTEYQIVRREAVLRPELPRNQRRIRAALHAVFPDEDLTGSSVAHRNALEARFLALACRAARPRREYTRTGQWQSERSRVRATRDDVVLRANEIIDARVDGRHPLEAYANKRAGHRWKEAIAIAHLARGRAELYYSDIFGTREQKLGPLNRAYSDISTALNFFRNDWGYICDLGSFYMRRGHWVDRTDFAEAEQRLKDVVVRLRPGYPFAAFELGRVYRLWGEFGQALNYFRYLRDIEESHRGILDARVHREIILAEARSTTFP